MSVVIPVRRASEAASTLERLPRLDGEVILVSPRPAHLGIAGRVLPGIAAEPETAVDDRALLRAGFAAARGDRIVVLDRDAEIDADDIERFVAALDTGCRSGHRPVR